MIASISVINTTYLSDYKIRIEFSDGAHRIIDFKGLLINNPHPQFDEYKDFEKFKQFKIERGNLVWGEEWDLIFPVEELHSGNIISKRAGYVAAMEYLSPSDTSDYNVYYSH